MMQGEVIVGGKCGLHAKPFLLVNDIARRYPNTKIIVKSVETGEEADARSILSLLTLAVECGKKVILSSDGVDENKVFTEVSEVLSTFVLDED